MRAMPLLVALIVIPAALILTLAAAIVFGTVTPPPPLASVNDAIGAIDLSGLPPAQHFTARDGAALAYRAYPGGSDRVVVLVHGSTGNSRSIHPLAKSLAAAGATVYALDIRGHGLSGRIGDIDHVGQLEDDMADFIAAIAPSHRGAERTLIGFSSGGGFTARIAGGPEGDLFDRYILLAPYLGYQAPTSRADSGGWAAVSLPRALALFTLDRLGIHWFEGTTLVAFARRADPSLPPPTYSYRLAMNFAAHRDFAGDIRRAKKPMAVIVGAEDDEMIAAQYAPLIKSIRDDVPVEIVPGIGHVGLTTQPAGTDAVRAVYLRGSGGDSTGRPAS